MKKFFDNVRGRVHQNWCKRMDSKCMKMSCGAQQVLRMMTWAHADNWRRKNSKKHSK